MESLPTTYRNVHDIYLDYNQISTIETLETDNWLKHFRAFSLKGNQLTKVSETHSNETSIYERKKMMLILLSILFF